MSDQHNRRLAEQFEPDPEYQEGQLRSTKGLWFKGFGDVPDVPSSLHRSETGAMHLANCVLEDDQDARLLLTLGNDCYWASFSAEKDAVTGETIPEAIRNAALKHCGFPLPGKETQ